MITRAARTAEPTDRRPRTEPADKERVSGPLPDRADRPSPPPADSHGNVSYPPLNTF
ncbi:hypothetical protein ACWGSK_23635 [Nocardiopsis sp. NPDC055551]